jgi:hypothetical protein
MTSRLSRIRHVTSYVKDLLILILGLLREIRIESGRRRGASSEQ